MLEMRLHATTVAVENHALVIQGSAASGKSSLALHLIESFGAHLISDDQTYFYAHEGKVYAHPPENLQGLLEVRGLGILRIPYRAPVPVGVCVQLLPQPDVERLPINHTISLCGQDFSLYKLAEHNPMTALHSVYALRLALGQIERAA